MPEKKIIEFVCTANNGRSPTEELIGKQYLKKIRAENEYAIASSGTLVDVIRKKELGIDVMKQIITLAQSRPVYSSEELFAIENALKDENIELVKKYFEKAENAVKLEEQAIMAGVLQKYGISGERKKTPDQTAPKKNRIAVLAVDQKNYERVVSIYRKSIYTPIIDIVTRFAFGENYSEIADCFGKGQSSYEEAVRSMIEAVPAAIDKLLI